MPTTASSTSTSPLPASGPPAAGYRGLRVWQRALDLTVEATVLARTLEGDGFGALATDLYRAGMAVPAHVAAGSTVGTRLEHQRAVAAALAALARFETVLAAAERLAPASAARCAALLTATGDVTRSLRAFARAIGGGPASRRPAAPRTDDAPMAPDEIDAAPPAVTEPDASDDHSAIRGHDVAPPPPPATPLDADEPLPPPMPARPARARRPRGSARTG